MVIIGSGFVGSGPPKVKEGSGGRHHDQRDLHHLFQPLLYQVATGVCPKARSLLATREVLKKQRNATVLPGRVTDIDIDAKTVTSVSPLGTTMTAYDSLIGRRCGSVVFRQ